MNPHVEIVEYWVLDEWQVTHWRHLTDPDDEWFTIDHINETPEEIGDRYASLYEAMLVVAAAEYIGDGVEDWADARALAFLFARQIGMHRWDGEEWVHTPPDPQ